MTTIAKPSTASKLPPLADSLTKPPDLFGPSHLMDDGPLVLNRAGTGLGQLRGLQARKAARYLSTLKPIELDWGKRKSPGPKG